MHSVLHERLEILGELDCLVAELDRCGMQHGDLHAMNIIVSDRGLQLIDPLLGASMEEHASKLSYLRRLLRSDNDEEVKKAPMDALRDNDTYW